MGSKTIASLIAGITWLAYFIVLARQHRALEAADPAKDSTVSMFLVLLVTVVGPMLLAGTATGFWILRGERDRLVDK